MTITAPLRPASDFPVGSKITLLDAWMKHPRLVRITKHPIHAVDVIIAEDARGVVYSAKTNRIVGEATFDHGSSIARDEDLLGDEPFASRAIEIEDLLG